MFSMSAFFEALVIVTALSMDAFVSAFAYGVRGIKIPPTSLLIMNLICSLTLFVALLFGGVICHWLPDGLSRSLCVVLLLCLGGAKIFDSAIKALIRRHQSFQKRIHFSIFHLGFILKIYANPECADRDHSRVLSPGEATCLALALSLDGMAVGFGAGLSHGTPALVLTLSFVVGVLAVLSGGAFGRRLNRHLPMDMGWLSGALLIVLAIMKLP